MNSPAWVPSRVKKTESKPTLRNQIASVIRSRTKPASRKNATTARIASAIPIPRSRSRVLGAPSSGPPILPPRRPGPRPPGPAWSGTGRRSGWSESALVGVALVGVALVGVLIDGPIGVVRVANPFVGLGGSSSE